MKLILNLFLSLALSFSGVYSQAVFLVNHSAYNGIKLDTSNVPTPIDYNTDDYIQLSEVKMHYRVYGEGKAPLILIHGNGGGVNSLSGAASYLANDYTVYVTESRCHGKSTDTDELNYDLVAKDIVEFISAMGLEKPVIMGHSDGAIIAITIAASYPDVPGAIIACGANSKPSTLIPVSLFGYTVKYVTTKNKLTKMILTGPDFTEEYLSKVTCPSYIVSAQNDIMYPSDTEYMHNNISGSDMAIIIGGDHSSYMSHDGKQAYVLATEWLDTVL